ncbi:MAG: AAA family ATPase [Anaerolineales bacterium]|nr:AAA family ATPase [Anaerolineales bacterium]
MLKETWLRLNRVIAENGGNLVKHVGDMLLVVWGVPTPGDSDPEAAVRTALALQEAISKRRSPPGIERVQLHLRIGIETGHLFALNVGVNDEFTMMGEAVSKAYHLALAAKNGMILIDEDTFRQVHGAFQVRRLEEPEIVATLKAGAVGGDGDQPIVVYQVEEVKATTGKARYGGIETMQTRMVGRDSELSRLNTLYDQALQGGRPVFALVVGEDGVGKSRLLMEFVNQVEAQTPAFYLMSSRALAQTQRVPFYLWKTLWQNRFGMSYTDTAQVASEKFMREVQRLWGRTLGPVPAVEVAHLAGSLIGLDWPGSPYLARFSQDALGRVNRGYELTYQLLCRAAQSRPTVLVLDDLQWADQDSLDLLGYLIGSEDMLGSEGLPLLVLGASRTEFIDRNPALVKAAHLLELPEMPVTGEIVAAAYTSLRGLPVQMLNSLAQFGRGNPYFLEEIVRYVLRSGEEDSEDATLETLARLRAQPPESLEAMLRSRLGDLTRMARAAAMLASISGRVFWVGAIEAAVRAMIGKATDTQLTLPSALAEQTIEEGLRQLVQCELVFPRANSSFSSEQEYIFKHDLLRDVAYSMIPVHYRKPYHLAIANWMAKREEVDFMIMAADHYEIAGASQEAMAQCEKAAGVYEARGAIGEAQMLMERSRLVRARIG